MDSSSSTTDNDNTSNWSSTVSLFHLDQGNTHMVNLQYKAAIQSFTNCILSTSMDLLTPNKNGDNDDDDDDDDDDDIKLRKLISFRAHSHRSEAYLQLNSYTNAKKDALKSHTFLSSISNDNDTTNNIPIQVQTIESKFEIAMSFIRLGKACMNLKDYDMARDALRKANDLIQQEKDDGEGYDYDYEHIEFVIKGSENACARDFGLEQRMKDPKDRLREEVEEKRQYVDVSDFDIKESVTEEEKEDENKASLPSQPKSSQPKASQPKATPSKSNDYNEITNKSTTKLTPTTSTTTTTTTPTPTPTPSNNKKTTCPKYQYYQNETFMTISILEPNLNESKIKATFSFDKLTVLVTTKHNMTFTVICGTLFSPIVVSKCKVKFMQDKVLIKLKKKHGHNWHTLFGAGASKDDKEKEGEGVNEVKVIGSAGEETSDNNAPTTAVANVAPVAPVAPAVVATATTGPTRNNPTNNPRPYASHRDWDAIERDLADEEENDKPDGESGFHRFMQKIYKDADEDTRRAMIKSYQTSGGTHLSCNWNEVAKTDYEKQRTGMFYYILWEIFYNMMMI